MKRQLEQLKPLYFTTTLRNPERMKEFLSVLVKYQGKILTNEIINYVVFDLVQNKIYVPLYVNKSKKLKMKLNSFDKFSVSETELIIKNSPQEHKEAGFEKGWPSRFDTWYKFLKELGFVYYSMNEPIEISESGMQLANARNEGYEHLEQQVFLNAFVKYQRNTPFKRVKNKNKPLILLLQLIKELHKLCGADNAGVSINEVPLIICWKDDNYHELANLIVSIRNRYGFRPSDEVIYEECKNLLEVDSSAEKRFKIDTLLHELPDEFIRKMRLTGLISIRGNGIFIDVNTLYASTIDYVLANYSSSFDFQTEKECYEYMKNMDYQLINPDRVLKQSEEVERKLFMKWVGEFELTQLCDELFVLVKKNGKSNNELFKYINEPLRLEFLTSLALQKQFNNIIVKPNYTMDDEGLPTSFASGNTPDIECLDSKGNVLFEVTMLTGTQQNIREMPAIVRHLLACKQKFQDSFSIILAPTIHEDTIKYAAFSKFKDDVDIIPLDILTFSKEISQKNDIREYLSAV